jgi:hypothetical protein
VALEVEAGAALLPVALLGVVGRVEPARDRDAPPDDRRSKTDRTSARNRSTTTG